MALIDQRHPNRGTGLRRSEKPAQRKVHFVSPTLTPARTCKDRSNQRLCNQAQGGTVHVVSRPRPFEDRSQLMPESSVKLGSDNERKFRNFMEVSRADQQIARSSELVDPEGTESKWTAQKELL